MKKVILSLSLVLAVLAVSCKNEAKSDTQDSSETTENTESTEKAEKAEKEEGDTSKESASGVPSFGDEKVQEYVNAYEAYIEDYKKAAESKDMTAFAELGKKGQELATKSQEVMGNLSGDDVKKLSDYMQAKSAQLQELSQKMMQ
ncbi:hypothetical protein [Aquimarina sediminis]|uniref:hypothetical protein n=1 Tax=Aquimarina sediminis TaxID=2070536 RepID=UPI000CA088F0|nr:hypothetical protein [Aquimarina sediminis]